MNKKLSFVMLAMTAMLFATSCSDDMRLNGEEVIISFNLGIENAAQTRAISDGSGVDKLVYAVFDKDGDRINSIAKVVKETSFPANETITLAKGETYQIAFWAQNKECNAYEISDDMNVSVSYVNKNTAAGSDETETSALNNDETRDAFFAATTITVTGDANVDVTLKRPFAQINVGVTKKDWTEAKKTKTITQSKAVFKQAASKINLLTGNVSTPVDVTYDFANIPYKYAENNTDEKLEVDINCNGEIEDGEKFYYISTSYILPYDQTVGGAEKATLTSAEFTFEFESGENIIFNQGMTNMPIQRNWRTNIVGQILTGDNQLNISLAPIYNGEYYNGEAHPIELNGRYYKTIEDAFAAAKNGDVIKLGAGTWKIPVEKSSKYTKTLTIAGTGNPEGTVIELICSDGNEGCNYFFDGSTITFENLCIKTNSETYAGFARCSGTYKNCIIDGTYWLYDQSSFEGCTFKVSGDAYNVWTWSVGVGTFKDCIFNCDGKSVLVYGSNVTTLTFNNCTFNDSDELVNETKAAIETGDDYGTVSNYTIQINNCTVNGFNTTKVKEEYQWGGSNSGTNVWGNKNMIKEEYLNIFIDEIEVY